MANFKLAWTTLLLAVVVFGGCQQKESKAYSELLLSDFGLEVSFGMSPAQVHEVHGTPSFTKERQGGASVEEFYLPFETTQPDDDIPSVSFTFNSGALIRVTNTYFPEDMELGEPPFFAEPVPGVKLGARRSGFVDALGPGEKGGTGETWRFAGPEDELITVKAWFTDLASLGDALCSKFTVTFMSSVVVPRGEAFKEKK